MTISVGDRLPKTSFVKATDNGPEQIDSEDYFKGRKVALFSVPGAFTPTCSAKHLPSYLDKADELKAKGVDEIACTAVNDAFVLGAWSKSNDAGDTVTMHSTVRIRDAGRDGPEVYTLVYPDEAAPQFGKLSVLTPVGTALLGTRAGDVVRVATVDGVRRIRVEALLYQPESAERDAADVDRDAAVACP